MTTISKSSKPKPPCIFALDAIDNTSDLKQVLSMCVDQYIQWVRELDNNPMLKDYYNLEYNLPIFNQETDQVMSEIAMLTNSKLSSFESKEKYIQSLLKNLEYITDYHKKTLRYCFLIQAMVIIEAVIIGEEKNVELDHLTIRLCEEILYSFSMLLNKDPMWFSGWISIFLRLLTKLEILYKRNKGYESSLITIYSILLNTIGNNEKFPKGFRSDYPQITTTQQQKKQGLTFQQIIQERLNKVLDKQQQTQQKENKKLHDQLLKHSGLFQLYVSKDSKIKHSRYRAIVKTLVDRLKDNSGVLPELSFDEFNKKFIEMSYRFPILQQRPVTLSLLKIPGKSKMKVLHKNYQDTVNGIIGSIQGG
jgi:hypothetical protein